MTPNSQSGLIRVLSALLTNTSGIFGLTFLKKQRRVFRAAVILAFCLSFGQNASAQPMCRQALALGLDVSGSVDAREYRLQLDGLATALGDPDVVSALMDQTGGSVRLAVYEWADPTGQRVVVEWTDVTDHAAISAIQTTLRQTRRHNLGPSTALGSALVVGGALLDQQSDCFDRTLDISGDGKGNTGRRPQDITDLPENVTVNGLVIGPNDAGSLQDEMQLAELSAYYSAYVIRGPASFVETARGFDDYALAMRRKLLRELTSFAIGHLDLLAD